MKVSDMVTNFDFVCEYPKDKSMPYFLILLENSEYQWFHCLVSVDCDT